MTIVLETERLMLKVATMNDYEDLLKLRTDPEVMSYAVSDGSEFGSGKIQTPEQIKQGLSLSEWYYEQHGLGFFCAYEKKTGDFIGQAGLFHWCYQLDQPNIELAYRFYRCYWGKGYGTELAKALIDWGFKVKKLSSIIAPVHPDNIRSVNILQKVGMELVGQIDHKGSILDKYCIENVKLYFQSKRLKYSLLSRTHINELYELDGNETVRKFFPDGALSHKEIEHKISSKMELYDEMGLPEFIIHENDTNKFVGRCGMGPIDDAQVEIGYVLLPEFWGKGYATEAALSLCGWAKKYTTLTNLIALAPLEHKMSHKVMEKIGMVHFKTGIAYGVECQFYKINLD